MRHCPTFRSTDDTGFPAGAQKPERFARAVSERLGRDVQLREAKPDWEFVLIDLDVSDVNPQLTTFSGLLGDAPSSEPEGRPTTNYPFEPRT